MNNNNFSSMDDGGINDNNASQSIGMSYFRWRSNAGIQAEASWALMMMHRHKSNGVHCKRQRHGGIVQLVITDENPTPLAQHIQRT